MGQHKARIKMVVSVPAIGRNRTRLFRNCTGISINQANVQSVIGVNINQTNLAVKADYRLVFIRKELLQKVATPNSVEKERVNTRSRLTFWDFRRN